MATVITMAVRVIFTPVILEGMAVAVGAVIEFPTEHADVF